MKKYIIILIAMLLLYLQIVASDEMKFIGLAFFILLILVALIVLAFFVWYGTEKMKIIRAGRIEAEKQAHVMTVTSGNQVFIRETDHNAWWRAAHLDNRVYANSKDTYKPPDNVEKESWDKFNQPKTIKSLSAKATIVEGEVEKQKQLFDLLDLYPHLMLIAPSGSGKTTQLSMVASHLLQQKASRLIWMSTHALEDKVLIPSQAVIIQSVDEIVDRLNEIVLLYKKRRDNPQSNYRQVIIIIDEWYDLSMEDGDIHKAISQLSSGARKFGIVLILASHTDNVSDTGLNKNLRRNFGRVRLDANLTKQKKALWMKHDKQSTWQEIELPNIEELFKSLIEGGLSKNKAAKVCYNRAYGGNLSKIE